MMVLMSSFIILMEVKYVPSQFPLELVELETVERQEVQRQLLALGFQLNITLM
tara:strand:- start:281 stop:439 length:159 start_codon:yes stop_codon:yes gene_type:complete